MKLDNSCFSYKELTLHDGLGVWDDVVDCCYVLLMANSSREKQIMEQIQSVPVSRVIFQINQGFRKCNKPFLKAQQTNYDLVHAFQTCFQHALSNKYKRILVLEDDCSFDNRIRDPYILNSIRHFLKTTNPDIYHLGSPLFFPNPLYVFNEHIRVLPGLHFLTAHACIYNQRHMLSYINHLQKHSLGHADNYNCTSKLLYTYKIPLAYQIFPHTENSNYWNHGIYGYNLLKFFILGRLNLHKQPQPGFDILYSFCKGFVFVYIAFFVMLFILLKQFTKSIYN